jgi:predicted HTH domain antitoxin
MSRKDCRKVQVLSRVKDKLISVGRAAELLGVSHRQQLSGCGGAIAREANRR